jgi:coenzyme F420 hydrogenase subunit beta
MMRVLGSNELVEDIFANDLCIGCGACVNLCPYYKNHKGKTTRLFACDLNEGRCYAFCPKTEVDMDELSKRIWVLPYDGGPIGNYRQVLSARAGEEMHQGSFQAGGTVSSLITFALKVDIIDAAALTDREGTTPVPRLVTNWEDVVTCASTKFMASPTLAALNTGIDKGFTSLGVVGTPCQMTAAAQMRTNPMQKSDFADPIALTVGLFCNWSLEARQLTTLLSVNATSLKSEA